MNYFILLISLERVHYQREHNWWREMSVEHTQSSLVVLNPVLFKVWVGFTYQKYVLWIVFELFIVSLKILICQ